jgi:radical SAM protein with 4Fe4S-binding SPASM domain
LRWPWDNAYLDKVHFDIVGGCQLRCVGCPNSTILPKVTRIKPDVFAQCLGNIDVRYVKYFRPFNYGEPLLHDNLPAIYDVLATAPKFKIGFLEMSTNAAFARWDQVEDVFRRRMLNRLVVSCDGDGTPDSYERFRPPAKWDGLIEFLDKARELRDRYAPDMELMTRTVYFKDEDKARWRAVLEPRGFRPEFRRWLNLVGGAESHAGRDWRPAQGMCSYVENNRELYVGADGTVVPCCAHPNAGDFGNLRTHKWSEIVGGQKRRHFVELLETKRAEMDICGQCEFGSKQRPSIGQRLGRFVGHKKPALAEAL